MTLVSLTDVGNKAFGDPRFWHKLTQNAEQALREAGLELKPDDMRKLQDAIKRNAVTIDLRQLVEHMHRMATQTPYSIPPGPPGGRPPTPQPWDSWPFGWIPR